MKPGTQKLLRAYYFIVDQIIQKFGDNKQRDKIRLNTAFKAFYRNSFGTYHTSLVDFEKEELKDLINIILITFSVEYGIYLLQPNDPEHADEYTLSEYLEYKNWAMDDDLSFFNGVKTLPEGFVLITDLDSLKRLKKGKRKITPENIEWKYGTILYVFSHSSNVYYKKILSEITPIEILTQYFKNEILYGPSN